MPYTIVKSGDRYCVHKKLPDGGTGKKYGCHDSKGGAVRQMRAMYASEGRKGYPEYNPSQKRDEDGQWVSGGGESSTSSKKNPFADSMAGKVLDFARERGKEGFTRDEAVYDLGASDATLKVLENKDYILEWRGRYYAVDDPITDDDVDELGITDAEYNDVMASAVEQWRQNVQSELRRRLDAGETVVFRHNAIRARAIDAQSGARITDEGIYVPIGSGKNTVFIRNNDIAMDLGMPQDIQVRTAAIEELRRSRGKKSLTAIIKSDDGARYMFLVTTNAYKDRENEIIKQDVLKELVESKWDGDAFTGDDVLLFWHKGEPIGDIVFADTVGRFLVEVAKERPDAEIDLGRGKTARISQVWDFIEQTSKQLAWGASHGFKFYPQDRENGVYNRIVRKWETSVLPVEYAANSYTYAGVKRNGTK